MRHEDQRAAVAQQEVFQPGDRVDVEVVGRLVEEHDVGVADEPARQQDAPLEPGGEALELAAGSSCVRARIVSMQEAVAPGVLFPRVSADLLDAASRQLISPTQPVSPSGTSCGQVGDSARRARDDHARLWLQLAGDELEQRGFAHAVAADEAQPLAALDLQVDVLQDEVTAEANAHIAHAE